MLEQVAYRALGALVLALLVSSIVSASVTGSDETVDIDVYPLLYYLNDVIEQMLHKNYTQAYKLSIQGLSIDVPEELEWIHTSVYKNLYSISRDYIEVEKIMLFIDMGLVNKTLLDRLRSIARELYRLSIDLERNVYEYLRYLEKYPHPYVMTPIKASIEKNIVLLTNSIRSDVESYKNTYLRLVGIEFKSYTGVLEVDIYPSEPLCGKAVYVYVYVNESIPLDSVLELNLSIIYGLKHTEQYSLLDLLRTMGRNVSFRLKILDAPSIEKLGITINSIGNRRWIDIIVVASIKVLVGEKNKTIIHSMCSKAFLAIIDTPSLKTENLPIIYYGQPYQLVIDFKDRDPVNISIYVNNVFYINTSLQHGRNIFVINTSYLRIGYNDILLKIPSQKQYVGVEYVITFIVNKKSLPVSIECTRLVITPLGRLVIRGYVNTSGLPSVNHTLYLYVDGEEVYRRSITGRFYIAYPLSTLLPIIVKEVRVYIKPSLADYAGYSVSYRVVVVNIVSLAIVFTVILVVLGLTPLTIHLPLSYTSVLKNILASLRTGVEKTTSHIRRYTGSKRFKQSILRDIILSTIYLLSQRASLPKPYETFREYLARISGSLGGRGYSIACKLFKLFEEDLYSLKRVDKRVAKKLLGELKSEISG